MFDKKETDEKNNVSPCATYPVCNILEKCLKTGKSLLQIMHTEQKGLNHTFKKYFSCLKMILPFYKNFLAITFFTLLVHPSRSVFLLQRKSFSKTILVKKSFHLYAYIYVALKLFFPFLVAPNFPASEIDVRKNGYAL